MQDSPKRGVGVEPKNGGRTDSHGFAETHFPESCRTNFLRSIMRLRWIAAIHYRKIQYSGELCIFSGDLLRCRGRLWRSRRFIYHIFMRFIWPQVERNGTQKWVSWVVWNQKKSMRNRKSSKTAGVAPTCGQKKRINPGPHKILQVGTNPNESEKTERIRTNPTLKFRVSL